MESSCQRQLSLLLPTECMVEKRVWLIARWLIMVAFRPLIAIFLSRNVLSSTSQISKYEFFVDKSSKNRKITNRTYCRLAKIPWANFVAALRPRPLIHLTAQIYIIFHNNQQLTVIEHWIEGRKMKISKGCHDHSEFVRWRRWTLTISTFHIVFFGFSS